MNFFYNFIREEEVEDNRRGDDHFGRIIFLVIIYTLLFDEI